MSIVQTLIYFPYQLIVIVFSLMTTLTAMGIITMTDNEKEGQKTKHKSMMMTTIQMMMMTTLIVMAKENGQ